MSYGYGKGSPFQGGGGFGGSDSQTALPKTIPLFPLRGALLLPRGGLPLNIFEPRYLAMIEYALGDGRIIGMVGQRSDGGTELYDVGCAGRITSFMETDDGRYLVTLTGISRFRILSETNDNAPFRIANVSWHDFSSDLYSDEIEDDVSRERLLALMIDYLQEVGLKADWDSIEGASAETIVTSIAMACPFGADEKQAILEAKSLQKRAETLITLMEMSLAEARAEAGDGTAPNRLQ